MTQATPQYILQSWPTARKWDRAQLDSPAVIKSGSITYHGWCTDVGSGGIGFTCAAPLQMGDEITISARLEPFGSLEVRGVVRHSSAFRFGCEFLFISSAEQQAVDRYIRAAQVVESERFRLGRSSFANIFRFPASRACL